MWHTVVLLLFFITFPAFISSLQCYSCSQMIIVNYLVTNETVPSFSNCQVINALQCSITVTWDENINITAIEVNGQNVSSMQNVSKDTLVSTALMEAGPYEGTPFFAHNLVFSCVSNDTCNDETSLKRILRSLVIEDQFRQELLPLMQVIYPFNPKTAACFTFNNASSNCLPVDLDDCQRCEISIDQSSTSSRAVCATCHRNIVDVNAVIHSATFLLNDRTQIRDHIQLGCQLKTCNSMININRVSKASNITFDFGKFFEK